MSDQRRLLFSGPVFRGAGFREILSGPGCIVFVSEVFSPSADFAFLFISVYYDQPRQHIKKQRHYFANKGSSSQSYGFPVVTYECESLTVKKA